MAYFERTVGELDAATRAASAILVVEAADIFSSTLDIRDTYIMLAASHVLSKAEVFFEAQILELTGFRHGGVSERLGRYIAADLIYEKERVSGQGRPGRPHRVFVGTEFGGHIFDLFQNPPARS
jgi:hypothetical protein